MAQSGFRRMQIVEVDSDEEPENASDPLPNIQVEPTRQGVDKAKQTANGLFSQGSVDESIRWFTKCIWLVDSKAVADIPQDQQSILHANRAFAYIAVGKWAEAEADCSKALALNPTNFKAKYRRAKALYELGNLQAALQNVDEVLKDLPDPQSSKEAMELKDQIRAKLSKSKAAADVAEARGFRKIQIVEVSDDESEEGDAEPQPDLKVDFSVQGIEHAKKQGNAAFARGSFDESVRWFSKGIWLVTSKRVTDAPSDLQSILHANRAYAQIRLQRWADADSDCSKALALNAKNVKAKYRRALARFEMGLAKESLVDINEVLKELPDDQCNAEAVQLKQRIEENMRKESPKASAAPESEQPPPAAGFKRMQIVEVDDDDDEEDAPAPASPAALTEPHPELKVEHSREGVEEAKRQGSANFSRGSFQDSAAWFAKGIWLASPQRGLDIPSDLRSVLHSNRAFALVKLSRWSEAEVDCTEALRFNPENVKARYRRAMARVELAKVEAALEDVSQVVKELPEGQSRTEALELRQRIEAKLGARSSSPASAKEPARQAESGGFKRMQIVEVDDDDEEDEPSKSSPQAGLAEPHPELKVPRSMEGVEESKRQGNACFSKGSFADSAAWFAKGLWLASPDRGLDVPADLRSVLHSNRAFALIKLQKWGEAEADCTEALGLNPTNVKARYRRAMARVELAKAEAALEDVTQVIVGELPEGQSRTEAIELRQRIEAKLNSQSSSTAASGWRRMQIVEADDDDDDDDEEEVPAKAAPAAQAEPGGFKRMQIVEVDDDEEDEPSASSPPASSAEPHPELKVARSLEGVEESKRQGNASFSKGSFEDSAAWFAKGIWLASPERGLAVPTDLRSVLHSNRAFALVKLRRWSEAEADCSEAIKFNPANVKARYRRAMARIELDKAEAALEDVTQVIAELPEGQGKTEAVELRQRIEAKLPAKTPSPTAASGRRRIKIVEADDDDEEEVPAKASPVAQAEPGGFKRMRIVEVDDDEEDEPAASSPPARSAEPHPELKVARSLEGVEESKRQGNASFSKGSFEDSAAWFAKGIWLASPERGLDVPTDLRSVLHSNRAFALVKLRRWSEAEADCSEAIHHNPSNVKAKYRRAMARFELAKAEAALEDVAQVISELPEGQSRTEAVELRQRIEAKLGARSSSPKADSGPPAAGSALAAKAQPGGFRRMQIVEVDEDDDEDEPSASSSPAAPAEPHPELKVAHSLEGVEESKRQGNASFSKGSFEDSAAWFAKGIWLASPDRGLNVPADLRSVLHSNRAFALVKLQKWSEAEADCSEALRFNSANVKARYRRAMTRVELDKLEAALEDVVQVIDELPESQGKAEAAELRRRVEAKLGSRPSDSGAPSGRSSPSSKQSKPKTSAESSAGWRRMQIVEAEDDSEEEPAAEQPCTKPTSPGSKAVSPASIEDIEVAKNEGNSLFQKGAFEESVEAFTKGIALAESGRVPSVPSTMHSVLYSNRAFANMQLKKWDAVERDSSTALTFNAANTKARFRRATALLELGRLSEAKQDADRVMQEMPDPSANQGAADLLRRITERLGSSSSQAAATKQQETEPHPDVVVQPTVDGVESAKDKGNALFAAGSVEESVRWFSKCLWVAKNKALPIPKELNSVLHSNRAFAYVKLERWKEAEDDCTSSLELNQSNTKARYRRAKARLELGKAEEALQDVQSMEALPDPRSRADAESLKQQILQRFGNEAQPATSSRQASSPAAPSSPMGATPSSPSAASNSGSPKAAFKPAARTSRAAAAAPAVGPAVPASSPRTASELLRNFHSMKRHPGVLARYVRERVPPQLLHGLFSRSPMEPDDLSLLIVALRTSSQEGALEPEQAGEYCRQLLRTHTAEMQLTMLSSSEKKALVELAAAAPQATRGALAAMIG